jgi:hypothetical protein
MTIEICKTDIKAIIGFLDDAATLVDEECQRLNKARLMRLMKQKLERKL